MRHGKKRRKLSRTGSHTRATLNNMATALFEHGRIHTTHAKAQALRPYAEKLITLAKNDSVHNRRNASAKLSNADILNKLFVDIAPHFSARPGGYTRILKTGFRIGDNAKTALIELVDFVVEQPEVEAAE